MRRCFYHTDLGQNAVFHNFAIQIALIQYSGRSKHAWAFSETAKKNSKITYITASQLQAVECLNEEMNINRVTHKEFIVFFFLI